MPRSTHAPPRLAAALVALPALSSPRIVHAQDVDAESLQQIVHLVRWGGVASSVLVVFAAWLFLRFVKTSVERLSHQFVQWRLALQQAATILQFLVYVVTFVLTLMLSFRLDARTLTVIGGGLAVSFGFAIKDLVASVVSGIVIMIDRPFQVGDRVLFEGEYGDVIAIGLRSVRIRTLDDNTVTIPNSKFLSDRVSSANYGELDMQVVMDFYAGLGEDVSLARQLVHDAAISSSYVYLPKPVVVLVHQVVTDSYMAVRLRLKAYVLDTRHEMAFQTDVNLRVLEAFRARGIRPPQILVTTQTDAANPS